MIQAAPQRMRTRSIDLAEAEQEEALRLSKKRRRSGDGDELAPAVVKKSSTSRSALDFCKEHSIQISGPPGFTCPQPMETFESTPFSPKTLSVFTQAGYTAPTVTQALAWPIALSGTNIVSVAKTGSGKTLGFLLPVFQALQARPDQGRGPKAPALLVMAPTRELACQIEVEASKFGRPLGLRSACVYGGAPKSLQIRQIRDGVDVIIGTPGRLQDLMDMGVLSLQGVKFLVLDEADCMLDMGFENEIRAIVSKITPVRQTLLFTATWPRSIQRLASEFAPNPVQFSLGDTDTLAANKSIAQTVEVVSGNDAKVDKLRALLTSLHMVDGVVKPDHGKTIIFVKFKASCNRVAEDLWGAGFYVNTLHGDMEQRERTQVIGDFRNGKLRVIVATDVAARGLDVKDVTDVINFDMAGTVEDYVHRIGRTGRAGAQGRSHTFFDPKVDGKNAFELVKVLEGAKQTVNPDLAALASRGRGGGGGGGRGRWGGGRGGGGGGRRW